MFFFTYIPKRFLLRIYLFFLLCSRIYKEIYRFRVRVTYCLAQRTRVIRVFILF